MGGGGGGGIGQIDIDLPRGKSGEQRPATASRSEARARERETVLCPMEAREKLKTWQLSMRAELPPKMRSVHNVEYSTFKDESNELVIIMKP